MNELPLSFYPHMHVHAFAFFFFLFHLLYPPYSPTSLRIALAIVQTSATHPYPSALHPERNLLPLSAYPLLSSPHPILLLLLLDGFPKSSEKMSVVCLLLLSHPSGSDTTPEFPLQLPSALTTMRRPIQGYEHA